MTDDRRQQLHDGLARTEERILDACLAAGRERDEVTLIVVTKFFPADDIAMLVDLGVRDIGENRDQEARVKVRDLATILESGRLPRLHFIAEYADVVHSVDRGRLAVALDRGSERAGRVLDVLVQVDLDAVPDTGRGGAAPVDLAALVDAVAGLDHLRLRGVMSVAPLEGDPDAAFARLAHLAADVRSAHPEAGWISAGMSADLEAAVRHGATHLRVGTAILGSRPSHR